MLAGSELPTGVVLEHAPCPMGCTPNDQQVVQGGDRISGVSGAFQVVRCLNCGLARTNPRPNRQSMASYYPDEYAPYQDTKVAVTPRTQRSLVRRIGRRVIDFNSDHLPPVKAGHALEIGCASGAFLAYLRSLGWSGEGVELNASAAKNAEERGFRVQNKVVEEMAPPMTAPKLIVAWMVLEHLHDPIGALQRLGAWAADDAWLVASVPNFSTVGARLFRAEWYPLQLPCHLYHYDKRTLGALLDRAGWKLERTFYHRTVGDYMASAGNMAETRGAERVAGRLRAIAKKRQLHLAMYPLATALAAVGETGRMTVWASRR